MADLLALEERKREGLDFAEELKFSIKFNGLAEREGFEPSLRLSPYTRFPGVRLKPLIHLSEGANSIMAKPRS